MNRKWTSIPATFASATALALSLQGCTLIGMGIGSALDTESKTIVPLDSWSADTLRRGDNVVVQTYTQGELKGTFIKTTRDSLPRYAERLREYFQSHQAPPEYPRAGDSITIDLTSGTSYRKQFLAYDFNSIVITSLGQVPGWIRTADITSIQNAGNLVPIHQLSGWVTSSSVPILTSVIVQDDSLLKPVHIPLSEISSIHIVGSHTGRTVGAIIGALADVTTIIVFATLASSHGGGFGGGSTGGSCPFIYSHDGRGYSLDAEAFSGAIVKSLQRTDSVRLDHLVPADGKARMRITNELPETQYIDQLTLLAVDHPRGSEVLPGEGSLHTITAAQNPFEARGYDGSTVTRLVASKDDIWWLSNPTGRDPRDSSSTRDGMAVRFHRPAGTENVKLVFTLRNTLWLTEIEAHLLELPGSRLEEWYARMNSSPESRDAFVEVLKREAMLRVDLWNGTSWETRSTIPFVGPFVQRSVVVPLDLRDTNQDELRIRLESAPGFWMIDRVQADFTDNLPLRTTPQPIARALDRKGKDIRSLLSRIDETYYVLEQGDEAEVELESPPAPPGDERSYFLLCTGFYTIHVQATGSPRRRLMVTLADEPGAFGRYTTDLFNSWLEKQLAQREQQGMLLNQ